MRHLLESVGQVRAHAVCGRERVVVLGILCLQGLELLEHEVEVAVRYIGRVLDIIFMVVVCDLLSQPLDLLLGRFHVGVVFVVAAKIRISRE